MRLATRLFVTIAAVVALSVIGLVVAADRILRHQMESDVGAGLEREARLAAQLVPADSNAWPEAARDIGRMIGHRVTLIDPGGRVRGDTEFGRDALPQLENHLQRPEVQGALAAGVGRASRRSASTNAPQMYVAVRGGPAGLAIVRVSATLATVNTQIHAVQRTVLGAGAFAVLAAAALAWIVSGALARPLDQLTTAARAIAAGQPPVFPDSRLPEVAEHAQSLHRMHEELAERFAELRREREETRTIVEAMSDGVIAANARGEIVVCNAAARRMLAFRDGAPLPVLTELFHEKSARALVAEISAGRDVEQRELELDGRTLLATGRRLPDGRMLLVMRDVTALRRLEAVRRDFVGNVSHELKTPLTSIAGYAETLSHELADPQARQFAETIVKNARRMQHLVDDLLDLSRIESGGWQPVPEPVDLEAAAREAWSPFAERAATAKVEFAVAVAANAATITGDPEALRQIFTNLYDNALRHTPPGARIAVSAAPGREGVTLEVRDTGAGIPSEHLSRIFERFYRVDPGRSREHGGTGLGLAIVKHLVEAQGGRVEAESRVGRGTTIRMVLPGSPQST